MCYVFLPPKNIFFVFTFVYSSHFIRVTEVEQFNIDISTTDAAADNLSNTSAKASNAQHKFGSGILRYCCSKSEFNSFFFVRRMQKIPIIFSVFRNRCKEKEMTQEQDESSTFEECE